MIAAWGIILLLFLSGCAVGPDYVKPSIAVPEKYKEADGWKIAQPGDNTARGPWWETFGDEDLNALESQVSVSNQNVIAMEAQFRQARALISAAQASYFPTITAGASFTRSQASQNSSRSAAASSGLTSDYLLPVNISWELDVWGRIRRTVEAAKAGAEASAADLEAMRLSSQTELALAYFQLRILDTQKQLLDATVAAYGKSLELTKNQYESGIVSKADMMQSETQLKATKAQSLDVGVQRSQFEHAIALLIGKPASSFSIPVKKYAIKPLDIPVGLPSELLERRPDIAAAERRVKAANARIGVAVAAYFPTVSLGATGGYESSSSADWLTWPSRFWAVGPSISETIFSGGYRASLTEAARAAYDATVANYRQTVLTGFKEVEDNVAALRILGEESRVQDEAVNAAQKYLDITLNQYKEGLVNYLNVTIAQAAALNTERTLITIEGRRVSAAVNLIKALGGGWQSENIEKAMSTR